MAPKHSSSRNNNERFSQQLNGSVAPSSPPLSKDLHPEEEEVPPLTDAVNTAARGPPLPLPLHPPTRKTTKAAEDELQELKRQVMELSSAFGEIQKSKEMGEDGQGEDFVMNRK
jgi:hypothetical protein